MKRRGSAKNELVVGVFVVVLFIIAGWLMWKLGAWQQPEHYIVNVRFDNAQGVKPETAVFMSGRRP